MHNHASAISGNAGHYRAPEIIERRRIRMYAHTQAHTHTHRTRGTRGKIAARTYVFTFRDTGV